MKKLILTTILFGYTVLSVSGQYIDYLGAGHADNIMVTSSSDFGESTASKTITGAGLDAPLMETSRFLSHATFGANRALIEEVTEKGFSTWIDEQMAVTPTVISPMLENIWQEVFDARVAGGQDPEEIFGPWAVHYNYAWWQLNMTNNDLLRQRVAMALSELLVVSINSDLRNRPEAMANYYDILINKAFDNYLDILKEVSLTPTMGYYLSHLNNPKEILEENIHPDENYAREIMQLFSIGLYELNNDGSHKLDGAGNSIPTYDNDDIKELAQVFTGLGPGAVAEWVEWTDTPFFGLNFWGTEARVPMIMYSEWHDTSPKELIGGVTLPAGQDGMTDINQAIEHLFNHANVGPFIARHFIQRLITSNPTPAYIDRVASVFNDNGQGVRGDMTAFIKALLLDPEARNCASMSADENGQLREPLVRYLQVCRALPTDSPLGRYWNNGFDYLDATGQQILSSPTVFNFFPPDYQPVGGIADANLVAPEFKLHNTATSVGFMNRVNNWVLWDGLMYSWEGDYGDVTIELNTLDLEDEADTPERVLNELDILFTHGQLTDETRTIIRDSMDPLIWGEYQRDRVRLALYLLLVSPDYNIRK